MGLRAVAARLSTRRRHWRRVDARAPQGNLKKRGDLACLPPLVTPLPAVRISSPAKVDKNARQSVLIFLFLIIIFFFFPSVCFPLLVTDPGAGPQSGSAMLS